MLKFYTSHCPKCTALARLMDDKKIKYEVIDKETEYIAIAEANDISSMPFASLDGKIIDSKELQNYIKNN